MKTKADDHDPSCDLYFMHAYASVQLQLTSLFKIESDWDYGIEIWTLNSSHKTHFFDLLHFVYCASELSANLSEDDA